MNGSIFIHINGNAYQEVNVYFVDNYGELGYSGWGGGTSLFRIGNISGLTLSAFANDEIAKFNISLLGLSFEPVDINTFTVKDGGIIILLRDFFEPKAILQTYKVILYQTRKLKLADRAKISSYENTLPPLFEFCRPIGYLQGLKLKASVESNTSLTLYFTESKFYDERIINDITGYLKEFPGWVKVKINSPDRLRELGTDGVIDTIDENI